MAAVSAMSAATCATARGIPPAAPLPASSSPITVTELAWEPDVTGRRTDNRIQKLFQRVSQYHEIHDGAMLSFFLQKTPFSVKEKRFLGWGREEPICQPKHLN